MLALNTFFWSCFYIRLKIGFLGIPITKEMKEMGWDGMGCFVKEKILFLQKQVVHPYLSLRGFAGYRNILVIKISKLEESSSS